MGMRACMHEGGKAGGNQDCVHGRRRKAGRQAGRKEGGLHWGRREGSLEGTSQKRVGVGGVVDGVGRQVAFGGDPKRWQIIAEHEAEAFLKEANHSIFQVRGETGCAAAE